MPASDDRDSVVIHTRIPKSLAQLIDDAVAAGGYTGRAELVRAAIRSEVER
jgi:Arc/MetJ-type ribon-helix-helix transcriptional regulator